VNDPQKEAQRIERADFGATDVVEPDRFQLHADIDVDRPGEYRDLTLWWLDALHAEFVNRPGSEVADARRLEGEWGYYRNDGPINVGDYDEGVRERFAEQIEAGPGNASFDVYVTHHAGGSGLGEAALLDPIG
jgi:hypothetical protein